MHFFYMDEAGCNGRDLTNVEQPIFVLGGIIVRDEGWNTSNQEFSNCISRYFNSTIPKNFELHASDIFSPDGEGFFAGHDREKRNTLVNQILDIVINRRHQTFFLSIEKVKLERYDVSSIMSKDYVDLKTPYLVSYDYLISLIDWFIREKLGRSARALAILDVKEEFSNEISEITRFRRYSAPNHQLVRRITEFSYPIDSKKNPMVQISDLVCFVVKKYLEIEAGYKEDYSPEIKNIFREFYRKIDARLIRKTILPESGRNSNEYNQFIGSISLFPVRNWKTRSY